MDLRLQAPARVGSHIDTPAWQSFELKMRARAAERRTVRRRRRIRLLAAGLSGLTMGAALAGGFHLSRGVLRPDAPMPEAGLQASLTTPTEPRGTSGAIARPRPADRVRIEARPLTGVPAIYPEEPPPTLDARTEPPPARETAPVRRPEAIATVAAREEPRTPPVVPAPAAPVPQPGFSTPADTLAEERSAPPPVERPVERPSAPLERVPAMLERPASTESAAVSSPAPATPAVRVDPREPVRRAIERYRAAYQQLDAAAARAVWPGVDEDALARAFGSLTAQEIWFNDCAITVLGETADATCTGSARIVPKVGGGSQSTSRTWRFTLRQAGEGWQIARATVR